MSTPIAGHPDSRRLEPLWDRVDRNRWRLARYLVLFWVVASIWTGGGIWLVAATVWLIGAAFSPSATFFVPGARFAFAAGAAGSLLYVWWAVMRSERWITARLGAVFVQKGEMYETKMLVKDMAIAAGMRIAPALYWLDSDNVNAFVFHAVGRRPVLGVTEGLVKKLTLDEQRAVFANLIARVVTRDTLVASAVTALMAPLQAWRDHRIRTVASDGDWMFASRESHGYLPHMSASKEPGMEILLLLPFGIPLVLLGEIMAASFRRSQLTAAEKSDAEGMLLLKDPVCMLSALEACVRLDNVVVEAGDVFGQLFYCWTGDSTNDDDDPEWRRVARLREVLGVEGHVFEEPSLEALLTPPAPRLSVSEYVARDAREDLT